MNWIIRILDALIRSLQDLRDRLALRLPVRTETEDEAIYNRLPRYMAKRIWEKGKS